MKYRVPATSLVETFCKNMKDGVLVTTGQLSKALGIANAAELRDAVHTSIKSQYSFETLNERGQRPRFWGNTVTVSRQKRDKSKAVESALVNAKRLGAAAGR
jgi:hypothetical protein